MRVIVVGAGLAGIACAWYLRQQGCEVTVIDRQPGPALETSHSNGGMLTPSQAAPWNEPGIPWRMLGWLGREDAPVLLRAGAVPSLVGWGLRFLRNSTPARFRAHTLDNARLAAYSVAALQELRARLGFRYDETTVGTLKVFRTPREFEAAAVAASGLASVGVTARVLDRGGLAALEPALAAVADRLAGGLHFPRDESGDARLWCERMAVALRVAGGECRWNTPVLGFDRDGARIAGVRTGTGTLPADAVVVAAGSYSPALVRVLGFDLPVRPVKGYSLGIPMTGWLGAPRLPIVDEHLHLAATPIGAELRVAGTAEFAGFDLTVRPERIANLWRLVRELFPDFAGTDVTPRGWPWCGLRPMTCDGMPILGATPVPNLFLDTGHGHLGWTMAAGSGQAVADVVMGREPGIDLRPFALARFARA